MKTGTQTALAVGVGYLLGRRHRLRWALILATAGATGKLGGLASQALRRAPGLLGASEGLSKLAPGLSDVADVLRSDLADAGKAAATAAVSRRVNALSDSLHDRAEALRVPAGLEGPGKSSGDEDGQDRRQHDGQHEDAPRRRPSGEQGDRARERQRRPESPGRAPARGARRASGSQEGEHASRRGGDRESTRARREGRAEAPVRRAARGQS